MYNDYNNDERTTMIAQTSDIVISGITVDKAMWYLIGFTHALIVALTIERWFERKRLRKV